MKSHWTASLSLTPLLFALAAPLTAHEGEEHGDHDAAHGGFVLMFQDLHFELVALPAGGLQIHYSDAVRAPLPAAVVSDVTLEIEGSEGIEAVPMSMSAGGDYWEGSGSPLGSEDTLRLAFVFQGEPLVLDVPASFLPAPAAEQAAMGHGMHAGH